MTDYPYEGTLIADPVTFQRAVKASITVYDVEDANNTTPLALKDLSGLPLANPLTSSADAFIQPLITTSDGVKLVGGGLTVVAFSPKGIRDAAEASAVASQASASAAAAAAGLVGAPADAAIAAAVNGAGTATKAALSATFVPKWKATTAYLAGDAVLSPSGDTVMAKANFTSGSSFNASNWNYSPTYAMSSIATLNKSGAIVAAAGTTKYPLPAGAKLIDVIATLGTTPLTRSVKITPRLNGSPIFNTQPEILAGATASARIAADLITTVPVGGGMLTCDVDQVGATGAITYVNSASSTTTSGTALSMTKPTGTQPGDILIAAIYVDTASVTITPAAGWAQIGSTVTLPSAQSLALYWLRTDVETGPYAFTYSASAFTRVACLAYRGCVSSGNPIAASATSTNTGFSGTISSPSVVAPADSRVVHVNGIPQHPTTVTLDARITARLAVGNYLTTGDEAWGTATATGTRSHTMSASANSANLSLALTPAPVDGTGKDMVIAFQYMSKG